MKREKGGMKEVGDNILRRIGGKEDNDSYTPRLRRIDGESLILWMGTE